MPVPQVLEDIVEVVRLFSGAHPTSHRSRGCGCSGTTVQEQIVDVLKVFLQERVSARIVEQIVDVPVLQYGGDR